MERGLPATIGNLIANEERPARTSEVFEKKSPVDGTVLCRAARSRAADVADAVEIARLARTAWAETPGVRRGMILHAVVRAMQDRRAEIARTVALETGKSLKDAAGETAGAIELGLFFAGEGQRLYGRTTTSGTAGRFAMTVRRPMGTAGLIVAANTPIANVAWKVFPALACGNAAVLKAAEDTPATAWIFGKTAADAGLPAGVLSVVQGTGREAGAPLVSHPGVEVISFTGSAAAGREIAAEAGRRLAKVSLELGGKNPFVVCDDADLPNAVKWACLSAFSNAGQRCAAASRLIVFRSVYERFRAMLLERISALRVGPGDGDDLGPVINERQLGRMLDAVAGAVGEGARVLAGGLRMDDPGRKDGCYMAPTLIEGAAPDAAVSVTELFGPIACLYPCDSFAGAVALANRSPYGLTACIHTGSIDRAMRFVERAEAGVVLVNAGTYGSEPHMPFGGVKQSGNGSREPGTEALDVYSNLTDVYVAVDAGRTDARP